MTGGSSIAPEWAVKKELERAREALQGLMSEPLGILSVQSMGPDVDAVLIAQNISKLSPFVSTQVENAVITTLTKVPGIDGLSWIRQDPAFPDAGLTFHGVPSGDGIEAKAWYVCGTEITARFRSSQVVLIGKQIYVVVVAWVMDRIIQGRPIILDYALFEAMGLAQARDEKYHKPPRYLVVEPEDTSNRPANLQQANTDGLIMQTDSPDVLTRAAAMVPTGFSEPPYTESSRELTEKLRNNFRYRTETNFAKLDRIGHAGVNAFKAQVLAMEHLGRPISDWTKTLRYLASDDPRKRAIGLAEVGPLYD